MSSSQVQVKSSQVTGSSSAVIQLPPVGKIRTSWHRDDLSKISFFKRDLFHKTSRILTTACEIHALQRSPDWTRRLACLPASSIDDRSPPKTMSCLSQFPTNWLTGIEAMEGRNRSARSLARSRSGLLVAALRRRAT